MDNTELCSTFRTTGKLVALLFCLSATTIVGVVAAQSNAALTPTQTEMAKQRTRLSSSDPEERRDALMKLGAMHQPSAARAAMPALSDVSPMIRALAAKVIVSIGPDESVPALIQLFDDKDNFVRREAAYALGLTQSRRATATLSERLLNDKDDGVRGAAAVALGEIADEAAVVALVGILAPELSARAKRKQKTERNPFVLRAVATSLGQIKSRAGTPALVATLENEKLPNDVRRECARSLGMIGDPVAISALKTASAAADPYLSRAAYEALLKISP